MKQIKLINKIKLINIKSLLLIFLIIQPIFDLKIFYNSISTLIRVIFISLFFLYYFIKNKNRKKYYILIYCLLILIYLILHHINALHFNSLIPGNFNYSFFNEFLYFVKMLCPFMLIFTIYNANFSKKDFLFIIKSFVLFFSMIIIFSNLFLFSYGSYSDQIIKANFFEWFNFNTTYTYQDLASKGLFEFANQISALLLMFLPFTIYFNLENNTKFNFIILCFNVFALVLLSTKVAVFGIGLVFAFTFLIYLLVKHSTKNMLKITVIFLIYILLLPFNPTLSRMFERKQIVETASSIISDVSIDEANQLIENYSSSTAIQVEAADNLEFSENLNYQINYIENNYQNQKINEDFILNRYPYKYDPDFWYEILTNDNENKSDYRYLEQSMTQRVVQINNNKYDKFFGITYTRVQNIFNIEKDFIMQYYSIGIIGIILFIGPYFVFLIYGFKNIILNKIQIKNIYLLLSIITIFMLFSISYYSGNLLNSLSFTIYFTIPFSIIFKIKEMEI